MRVIEHGKKEFIAVCEKCGCKFAYTKEDISVDEYVKCPDCGFSHLHRLNTYPDNHKWLPDITWPDYLPVQPIKYPDYPPAISVYAAPAYPYWKTTTSTEYTYTKEDE